MAKNEIARSCHLYPMPIVMVGAQINGKPNFMTAAFCGMMKIHPPIMVRGLDKMHFTTAGISENDTFSVNIPSTAMLKVVDYCGLVSGYKQNKSGQHFLKVTNPL